MDLGVPGNVVYEEDQSIALSGNNFVPDHGFTGEYVGEYVERHTILVDGGEHFGVSAVAFDTHEELLWMGNQGGHVTSYYGPEMQKYTSFQVHANEEVRCLHTVDGGALALTPSSLRYQMRRGIPIFTHCSDNLEEMQCLLQLKHSPDNIILGGHSQKLVYFNLHAGEIQTYDAGEGGCAILRQHGRYVCCGDPSGLISLRDPNTMKIEQSIETHTGSLSDFDVHGNLLVTCGFSNRNGGLTVDNLLLVFDLRMMRSVAPISVLIDPFLLRFMPTFSSRLAIVSPAGQLQFAETVPLSEPDMSIYQVDNGGSLITALDVTLSSQAVVVGDAGGSLHFFSSNANPVFNAFARPTEFPDPPDSFGPIDIDDPLVSYGDIPFPDPNGPLLSDWPEEFTKKSYRRQPPIDPEILRTMKMQGTVGYAPNPNTRRRNQIADTYIPGKVPDAPTGDENNGFIAIPRRYRKLDIKYFRGLENKYSNEDENDQDYFNKVGFSGLDGTMLNSYCNSLIQVLFFTESVRQEILLHTPCREDLCVTCELGFLFHMLENSRGYPAHSGNLLRALRSAKEASALRLILPDSPVTHQDINFIQLIQSWNRFILHQIHSELLEAKKKEPTKLPPFVFNETDFPTIDPQQPGSARKRKTKTEITDEILEDTSKGETEISRILGSQQTIVYTCLKCSNKSTKEVTLLAHNLTYPKGDQQKELTFCEIVTTSLTGSQVTPAWCELCHKFQPTLHEKNLKSLPSVLSLNCGNTSDNERKFWKEQTDAVVRKAMAGSGDVRSSVGKQCRYGSACTRPSCRFKHPHQMNEATPVAPLHMYYSNSWVPFHMKASLNPSGELSFAKIEESQLDAEIEAASIAHDSIQTVIYDLYGVVVYIDDEKKNTVSIINTSLYSPHKGTEASKWNIFNDFCITPVASQEVVWFSMDWKIPCVLYWKQHYPPLNVALFKAPPISPDVLLEVSHRNNITPLSRLELPKPGDLVAIDAEFVTLNREEAEIRDGKLATVKPSHMSVARISCVRGQGPLEGVPFIDDYISTQDQICDYMTKYSGIKPGDLDVMSSSKSLTSLKSTYVKLRCLIDNGVVFIGHGLKNDFRVINLVVPPEQVIDTVHLFHFPNQRMVSLRFLAWHFLGLNIQSETHDSIEDARTALQLYKKYKELQELGTLSDHLKELYAVGKLLHWAIPDDTSQPGA